MKVVRLRREATSAAAIDGCVLCHELRANGARAIPKGVRLAGADLYALLALDWQELHLLRLDIGDVHEADAGARLAAATAGANANVGIASAGHWPISATRRGVLTIARDALDDVNAIDGMCVYTLWDGQIVDAGETVARAKIAPFAIEDAHLARAERMARDAAGLVAVRPFESHRIGAIVQESLGDRASSRFREALGEKVAWFGSTLVEPEFVAADPSALTEAFARLLAQQVRVITVAGTKSMDPLDPAFDALARVGARIERHGVPAHPGSLFWLAYIGDIPILGMPTCGLFSQASVFDLVLPRVLAGERITAGALAALGQGGLLTRDMAFRFPPYRATTRRGELDDE